MSNGAGRASNVASRPPRNMPSAIRLMFLFARVSVHHGDEQPHQKVEAIGSKVLHADPGEEEHETDGTGHEVSIH